MADDDDLDYSDTNVGSAQTQPVRKNISIKLKGKGRGGRGKRGGRGRRSTSSKKTIVGVGEDDCEETRISTDAILEKGTEKQISDLISYDDVISKLEASPFIPMDRACPEPLHQNKKLQWNHKVNLIGEKVIHPTMHCCEKCTLPILTYGRMIPCKHVSCYDCAKKSDKNCFKCEDKVQRVEQNQLGSIFMCTFGGAKYGPITCGRTYLSDRDLQAHVNHRHLKPATSGTSTATHPTSRVTTATISANPVGTHMPTVVRDPRDPRNHMLHEVPHSTQPVLNSHAPHPHRPHDHRDSSDHSASSMQTDNNQQRQYPHSPANYPNTVPVSSARPNLITVPIQDDSSAGSGQLLHSQQPHPAQYPPAANTSHPLPPHANPYPPPHAYTPHAMQVTTPTYSQAPPPVMTTQAFTPHAPAVHHPPPPSIHPPPNAPNLFTTPPPSHHMPRVSYTVPQPSGNPHPPRHLPPPQRFPGGAQPSGFKEPYAMQPWNPPNVPPPNRNPLPPPSRAIAPPPSSNHPHIPPRGPSDAGYRTPYYQ